MHLEFGGSTASRTNACPAWHVLARTLPTSPGSDAANLGTGLHAAMDSWWDSTNAPMVGDVFEGIEITADLKVDKLEPAYQATLGLMNAHDIDEYESEVTVRLNTEAAVGGTADFVGLSKDHKTLVLADYKFGDGVLVDAVDNEQLLHYAACLMDTESWRLDLNGVETIVLAIIQPVPTRPEHPLCSEWSVGQEDILTWLDGYMVSVDKAVPAIAAYEANKTFPEADLIQAGSHCKFCPAMPVCPRKSGLLDRANRLDPQQAEDLGAQLTLADEMEQFIKSVRKLAHEQMDRGDKLPGWKLVQKRAYKQWTDEAGVTALAKRLRRVKTDEALPAKLLSPAQMIKLFDEHGVDPDMLSEYYGSHSSGTTIAPAEDKRPEAPSITALKALAARTAT